VVFARGKMAEKKSYFWLPVKNKEFLILFLVARKYHQK
jgi:hypothetical protein